MKAIKSKKKVNVRAFLRTFPRRCEIYPLRHGRGGRARRRGGEKNVGTFFENKGTFLGKWGGKGEKPRAFCTDFGRRAHGLGRRARREGALGGCSGVGRDARRRKGAQARAGVGAPWAKRCDEKACWGCASAVGAGGQRPKGRAGGGGARNNVYLCGRLTDFFLLHRMLSN